jgi:hypothetical protein
MIRRARSRVACAGWGAADAAPAGRPPRGVEKRGAAFALALTLAFAPAVGCAGEGVPPRDEQRLAQPRDADSIAFAGPGSAAPPAVVERPPDPAPAFAESASGRRFVLDAETAVQTPGSDRVDMTGVTLTLLDAQGCGIGTLRARAASYDRRTEQIVATGNVRVELTTDGRRLLTEELHYLPPSDSVWSRGPATFEREGLVLRVERFESDAEFRRVTTWGARGIIRMAEPDR